MNDILHTVARLFTLGEAKHKRGGAINDDEMESKQELRGRCGLHLK